MKITIGGNISMKIMPQAYEPIEASSTFLVENEFPNSLTSEEIEVAIQQLNDKANRMLKTQVEQKMEIILKSYKDFKSRIKEIMNS
jgi:hypothetical protein